MSQPDCFCRSLPLGQASERIENPDGSHDVRMSFCHIPAGRYNLYLGYKDQQTLPDPNLLARLFQRMPSIEVKRDRYHTPNRLLVTVTTPGFVVRQSRLYIEAYVIQTESFHPKRFDSLKIAPLPLKGITPIKDKDNPGLIRAWRFEFDIDRTGRFNTIARVKHIDPEKCHIPPREIDEDNIFDGWLYSDVMIHG